MNLAHWAAAHRRSILFLVIFLATAGLVAAFKLPVALFPNVNFPRISVSIEAGDRPADQMVIAVTRKLEQAVRPVPGVESIRSTSTRGSAEMSINIRVDRDKAALEGVDPDSVTRQLDDWFSGIVTTQVQQGVKMVGIRVWVPKAARRQVSQIGRMQLRAPDGHLFPLKRIAQVEQVTGQPQITRENLKRMVAVTGRIHGRDMGSTLKEVKQVLARTGLLPPDVYYELGGPYQQQQIAFKGLVAVFLAALGLVFLLLLLLYEEFAAAIAILGMPLLAVGAVFIGLWLTGIELNITAMMGMTMILGIVTEVSIFYFSEYHELLHLKMARPQALIQAGVNRMRPITMTTLAAILALMPLALGLGQGSAMQQPLAVAIISGLLVQVPLVIIVMPSLYRILARVPMDV